MSNDMTGDRKNSVERDSAKLHVNAFGGTHLDLAVSVMRVGIVCLIFPTNQSQEFRLLAASFSHANCPNTSANTQNVEPTIVLVHETRNIGYLAH